MNRNNWVPTSRGFRDMGCRERFHFLQFHFKPFHHKPSVRTITDFQRALRENRESLIWGRRRVPVLTSTGSRSYVSPSG